MANPISSQNGITISGSQILVETGKATLKEDLTIASGESIEFESGASITNPEKLTLADGVGLLVNGEEHTHNTNGNIIYTWEDGNNHIKNVACKDCPIGYVTKETESHSIGENGFCACDNVYQPAELTAGKYDIDGDGSKDAVYEISNAGQLYWFAGLVNGTTSKVYVSGTHEDGSTATTDTTVKDSVTYYVFTCEVAAKEMTSDIKAQMIGNNGEKTGRVHTYTVKEYGDYILSHTSAEESNYGSCTQ